MIATTRLLTTVSVVSAVCRSNIHVRVANHREKFKIIRLIDAKLRYLSKIFYASTSFFATYVDIDNSMINCVDRQYKNKYMVMRKFVFDNCQIQNNYTSQDITSNISSNNISERIIAVHDSTMENIKNLIDLSMIMGSGVNRSEELAMTKQKYKSIRKWRPFVTVTPPVNLDTHFIVRIISYNILAQILLDTHFYLYREHDDAALYWETRKALLQQEILKAKANIVCLQEMQEDHLKEFVAAFESAGYKYLYKKRTNDKRDGLLLLYRADQLKLVDHAKVELYQSGIDNLNRDNVAIIAKFSLVESPETHVVISTTHLLYNPKRDDIRLAQTQLLFAELERLAFIEYTKEGPRYHPIILSGDFNLQPFTGVYKFITEGSFEFKGKGRNLEPALIRRLGNSLIPSSLLVTDNCQHMNLLTKRLRGEGDGTTMIENIDEKKQRVNNRRDYKSKDTTTQNKDDVDTRTDEYQKVKIIEGQYAKFSSGGLTHPFKLYSLYQHADLYGEPEATTHQGNWVTVDYIFFSGVEPIDKYNLPTVTECKKLRRIPNSIVGSDHLCLGASFKLTKKTKR